MNKKKILRINVSNGIPKVKTETASEYAGLGGRGLTSAIVSMEVPADCHPLGPENKLVIAPGLLSGTGAPSSSRLSVGCKSPLTGGIKEANAGGQGAQVLSALGYAAIILEGERQSDDWYVVRINESGVKIDRDNSVKMLTNYQLMKKFKDEYLKRGCMISIGTAGEMRMANSTVAVTDPEGRPTRHAGRGGVGAVMGSKGIKAIILDGKGCRVIQPVNPEKFKEATKRFAKGLKRHHVTGETMPAYGTNGMMSLINAAGAYPTHNFRQGQCEHADDISGETLTELVAKRGGNPTHGCHRGCIIKCSGIFLDKYGKFVSKQPEYETIWAFGGSCGISDLDAIAKLDFLNDDFGLDTIEMGVSIGIAMEAGLLEFGDGEGAINLVLDAGKGVGLGRVLGSGAEATAKAFGIERAPVVKGQAMAGYDPRSVKGQGVTYATSPMGADHTAGYAVAANILKIGGDVDALRPEGQVELSRDVQIATAALDATGICLFAGIAAFDQPDTFQALIDMINAFLGVEMRPEDITEMGKRILESEIGFNRRAGLISNYDRLPGFFKRERLRPHNVVFDISDKELDEVLEW